MPHTDEGELRRNKKAVRKDKEKYDDNVKKANHESYSMALQA